MKICILKNHGFFDQPKPAEFDTVIEESMIKGSLIRTKQIVFDVTSSCNLKCAYCSQGELYGNIEGKNSKNVNTHSAINLLKYIFDLKRKNNETKLTICFMAVNHY